MAVPADPKRPWKAYVATAVSALSIFVTAWVSDTDPFTAKEIGAAVVAALLGAGLTGAGTFAIANPAKRDTGWKVDQGEAGEAYLGLIIGVLLILILVVVLLRVL